MTVLTSAMTTRNWVLTTVKTLERALRHAEFDGTAADSAPFYCPAGVTYPFPHHRHAQVLYDGGAARYLAGGGTAIVMPWRRKTSIIFARSGGPPPAPIASAASRK
jgi:hypothetical protein